PLLGFTVNVLTLLGLVLAIGIVVDDAIVVVEAVEHHMRKGLGPREAAIKAMQEVSGAVIAIALILVAVFVPVAFLSGITGQLYRQFAITIAVSVVLSAINALTLSPALCALLLRKEDGHRRSLLAPLFAAFNAAFDRVLGAYSRVVQTLIRRGAMVAALLAIVLASTWQLYRVTPTGFLPSEDEGWLIVDVALPSGASLERTSEVMKKVERIMLDTPGVRYVSSFGGSSFVKGDLSSSVGALIAAMTPWDEREAPEQNTLAVVSALQRKLSAEESAFILVFNPPPISGLGNTGGFNLKLQDRSGGEVAELARVTDALIAAARQDASLAQVVSTFVANEPQLNLQVDRERARSMGVPITDVYQTLQTYLGGLYVNDFNLFGRTFRVVAQADREYRRDPEDISRYYVRSGSGQMVPLRILVNTEPTNGPLSVGRYNLFRSADVLGAAAPGYSTGQALQAVERLANRTLPARFGYEWTTISYQEKNAESNVGIFVLALLMVFLLLAAQYESWIIPIAVLLGVPAGVFGAIFAEWYRGIPDDVYCRVGLIMLIGLAAKNAILIVEFARQRRESGSSVEDAAQEAAKLRFRPILMTSFAFILGVVPLMLATGAGSASRRSLGTAVFGGMLAATLFGVFMVPTFYTWCQRLADAMTSKRFVKLAHTTPLLLAVLLLQGCMVGPNYKAPKLNPPERFRSSTLDNATSMGDLQWAELFQDRTLQALIREGLANNYDLRIAAQRVEAARAQVTITRASQLPFASTRGAVINREISRAGGTPGALGFQREITVGNSLVDLAFQLDFWGRYRRLTEAARNELLAQEWAQRTVVVSLVADVATTYFELIELDRELEISRQTLVSRQDSLALVSARERRGVASGLDVSQAESLVRATSARIPALERRVQVLENTLSLLLGRDPGAIPLRERLESQAIPSTIPPGLPGQLLQRRPDLQQTEALLRAANARVGVATASLFPQFSITGIGGFESFAIDNFVSNRARQYQVGGGFTAPLFNSGALRANVRSSRAQAAEAEVAYERSFRTALRETADALVSIEKIRDQRVEQELLVEALRQSNRRSRLLYEGGVASYLQVLDADRNLFEGELALAEVKREELLAVVRLYRALGGGWR
ncbi:MAG TPA: efflux RND transporter permease subunit, partial [Bryobacteraceae bacterium]|nr:efflux RND transporter permease subunit [Bryobacteraceae bacterium]